MFSVFARRGGQFCCWLKFIAIYDLLGHDALSIQVLLSRQWKGAKLLGDEKDQSRHWLGHSDTGMSPIVITALVAARLMLLILAGLVVLIIAVYLWQKIQIIGGPMAGGDWGMLGVLAALVVLPLLLACKIGNELTKGR